MSHPTIARYRGSGTQMASAAKTQNKTIRLLLVAPGEHLIGGASASTRILQKVVANLPTIEVDQVDSAPPSKRYGNKRSLVTSETINRSVTILRHYSSKIKQADAVLLYTNNQFTIALGPLLWLIARLFGKPIYLKPVGGDLDLDISGLSPVLRIPVLTMLRKMDGIMAQTQLLQQALTQLGCPRVHYIPSWRMPAIVTATMDAKVAVKSSALNLVYLSQIREEKGIFELLEALRQLENEHQSAVCCDFYGPIYPEVRDRFMRESSELSSTRYLNVVPYAEVQSILSAYDALVLPTHLIREGHPGIIVEALQMGVPVISTNWRAIPELVEDGVNGLLVPTHNPTALAGAIRTLSDDLELRRRMEVASRNKGKEFDATDVVPRMLNIIFPELATQSE